MNVVILIGRLVADPELKYTPSGIAVASFTIAIDRPFKTESGEKETDFLDIVAWRQRAEFAANYLSKGRLVAVHGRVQVRSWVQQDGQKRRKWEIVADNVQGLDKPREGQGQGAPPPTAQPGADSAPAETPTEGTESDMDYDPFAEE
jgi:single-strand DNA-binding protein